MKKFLVIMLIAVMGLGALPALAQDGTIVDIAAGNPDLSTLVAAVDAAGLTGTLASGEFTVFAPRNGAFDTLLSDMDTTADALLADTDLLTSVLTYHVVPGTFTFDDLVSAAADRNDGVVFLDTVNGAQVKLLVDADAGTVVIDDGAASVVEANVTASNGVVHVIDNVLLPSMGNMDGDMMATEEAMMDADMMSTEEIMDGDMMATEEAMMDANMGSSTIADLVAGNPDLSTLAAALDAAGLTSTLAGGEFTVFAPRDGAFDTLLTSMSMTADDLLADTDALADTLTYHVIEGSVTFDDLVNLAAERNDGFVQVPTVNGAPLTLQVNADAGTVIINNGQASVAQANITASNGVVHILDNVLVPPADADMDMDMMATEEAMMSTEEAMMDDGMAMMGGTITDIVAATPEYSTLLAAVQAAGLGDTLATGEYTVFAPTNVAFSNLLSTTGLSAEELLASDLLSDILLYHVVEGTVLAEDVVALNGSSVATVAGPQVSISVSDSGIVTLNGVSTVTSTDIVADNGVIHAIDEVLLPQAAIDALGL